MYPFKFNRAWLLEDEFDALVTSSWKEPSPSIGPMFNFNYKLQRLKNEVKTWEKKKNRLRTKELAEIDIAIVALLSSHPSGILSDVDTQSLVVLKSRKDSLLAHHILTWKLKSRVDWIQEGDANTKFFHSHASDRRNLKSIWALNNKFGEPLRMTPSYTL